MFKRILDGIFLTESLKSATEFARKSNISTDTFAKFNAIDTTPTKKLIHQILRWYIFDAKLMTHTDELTKCIATFIKLSGNKIKESIEIFKTYDDFKKFITPFLDIKTKSEKKDELSGQYKKVFENENMLVVIPFTHKASCIYGAHTQWCTTARTAEYFKDYQSQGYSIYYVMNKLSTDQKDLLHKMAVVVNMKGKIISCYDVLDEDQPSIIKRWLQRHGIPVLSRVFKPIQTDPMFIKNKMNSHKTDKAINFYDSNIKEYIQMCKDGNIDEIYPVATKVYTNEVSFTKLPPIPKSVTKIDIDESSSNIRDFESINSPDRNISVKIIVDYSNVRKFVNCNNVNCSISLYGYFDNVKQKLIGMLNSKFKNRKINYDNVYDYTSQEIIKKYLGKKS